MAQIDLFVRNMWRFGAHGVVLASGANVVMRLPSGDRFAAQNTAHVALVEIIEEIAGDNTLALLRRGQPADFNHVLSGGMVRVRVEPHGKTWRVEITPKGAPPADLDRPRKPQPAPSIPNGATPTAVAKVPVASIPAPQSASKGAAPDRAPPRGHVPVDRVVLVERPAAPPAPPPPVRPSRPRLETRPVSQPPADRAKPRAEPIVRTVATTAPTISIEAASATDVRPIDRLLRHMREAGASDLHLTSGAPPAVRVDGEIRVLEGEGPLSADSLLDAVRAIAPEEIRAEFAERSDADFAYELAGVSRFRINLLVDRRGPAAVIRAIPFEARTPGELALPHHVVELCNLDRGLVLVAGPSGNGKSTTIASLIDHINRSRAGHIVTIEKPIEFVHESKRCLVRQREVGRHTRCTGDAVRAALREDPDVVLVGEIRDMDTIGLAFEAAETGHLVFGTLQTATAAATVDRILDQFPVDRQGQIRRMLCESLRGVIAQTLCRREGGGRVAAYEILLHSDAVANLIREGKTFQIPSVMQSARGAGMMTLNDALLDLVRRKVVSAREALRRSHAASELRTQLQRDGISVDAVAA